MHKFSIVIATWNRKDAIRNVLEELKKQQYINFEIIVVDNGSVDGTSGMVETEYPDVKLIGLEDNLGCQAYNIGLEKAIGDFVVFMDNDAFLKEDALRIALERFETTDTDVIAMNIVSLPSFESETKSWKPDTPMFHGAGVIMKKSVVDSVGGYDKNYFVVHSDLELATRIINKDFKIFYDKEVIAYHMRSSSSRLGALLLFYSTRNALYYYWKYYPYSYAFILSLREALYGFVRALKVGGLLCYIKGLCIGLVSIPLLLSKRTPLRLEVYLRMRRYVDFYFREPVIKKIFNKLRTNG